MSAPVLASSLTVKDLSQYPPLARALATQYLETLRTLPLLLSAMLLRQLVSYDWQFPAERESLGQQLALLASPNTKLRAAIDSFAAVALSPSLLSSSWASQPERFSEQLTSFLWSSHQIDAFRDAAVRLNELTSPSMERGASPLRLCIVLFGRDASAQNVPLFDKLRPHGTCFTNVDLSTAFDSARAALQARATADAGQYAHWYIEGGRHQPAPNVVAISYEALAPLRHKILDLMHSARTSGTVGPEDLRSLMLSLQPRQVGSVKIASDDVLRHFELSLLTDGSGTQIFSTTFVQWAGREVLRRAQPSTLLLRYASRQRNRPMNDLLLPAAAEEQLDPHGSLIDADMGAFYTWINLMRLSGAEKSRFIACHEGGCQALAVAPGIAAGTVSSQPCDLARILRWTE
jgi:hypothetical protein